jgi:DNA-binding transcriptional LysR family regulator
MSLVNEPLGRGRIVASLSSSLLVRRSIAAGVGLGKFRCTGRGTGWSGYGRSGRPLPYDVWLVTHADLRHTARVRAVIDEIVAGFAGTGE